MFALPHLLECTNQLSVRELDHFQRWLHITITSKECSEGCLVLLFHPANNCVRNHCYFYTVTPLRRTLMPNLRDMEERRSGARLTAALDLTLCMAAETATYRGLDVTYITPYASSVPWNIRLDEEFEGDSVCDTMLTRQIYHGFSATFPQPEGDAAGATAVLHGARRTDDISFYGRMARKVIREAPSLAALVG